MEYFVVERFLPTGVLCGPSAIAKLLVTQDSVNADILVFFVVRIISVTQFNIHCQYLYVMF